MKCPLKGITFRPSMCLTCEHCGGLNNGGVLCFKANRRLDYGIERFSEPDRAKQSRR
ncbi:MAG TPA: hypothetical protein GX008_08940 [Firmicutes bacterium]|nr:hypothetical protein [Bacillota bacterium]